MKSLDGSELAGFIKERHARQVQQLTSNGVNPKLAIIQAKDDPVINTYVSLKQKYGADIGALVEIHKVSQSKIPELVSKLNKDKTVHGIIVQLPLEDILKTDEIVNLVASGKDVDALGKKAKFTPATPMAILWLLAGYNVDLSGKQVLVIGRGRLVGVPLTKLLIRSGVTVTPADEGTKDLKKETLLADVIITATGVPRLLDSDMIKPDTVVIDAGTASDSGKTVGDLAEDVYKRDDLTLTPKKGGVGPLTVCALFENLITAAENATKS